MTDLTFREILLGNLARCAATLRHTPNPAEVRWCKIDIPIVGPRAAALKRRLGKILHGCAAYCDLAKLSAGEETNPLSIGKEERTLTPFRALEHVRVSLTQSANKEHGFAVAKPGVGEASTIFGYCHGPISDRIQFVTIWQHDTDMRHVTIRSIACL